MGMYDDFRCEYRLPKYPHLNPRDLQTKDLAREFKIYTLKTDGQLWATGERCHNCGHDMEDEYISEHTGWVNAYTYVTLDKDFNPQRGYKKDETNYCLHYDFKFEFSRGKLILFKDDSFCSVLERKNDLDNPRNSMFREIKRLTMDEYIALSKPKPESEEQ